MASRAPRLILWCISAGYVGFVLAVGFWPTPVDQPVHQQITETLTTMHTEGLPQAVNYNVVEFTSNIWFFVPIGVLFALLLSARRWWAAVLSAVALSGLVELGQLLQRPARYASWYDLEANSLGALIGAAAILLGRVLLARYRASKGVDLA